MPKAMSAQGRPWKPVQNKTQLLPWKPGDPVPRHFRKSIYWEDKQQKITKKKEWIQRSHTFPRDLNLYLIVNHDNPLSTAGASAKALYNRHPAEFHYCYLKSATENSVRLNKQELQVHAKSYVVIRHKSYLRLVLTSIKPVSW